MVTCFSGAARAAGCTVGLILTFLLSTWQGRGETVTALESARAEYHGLLLARDAWVTRLRTKVAADEAVESGRDFAITLRNGIVLKSVKDGIERRRESSVEVAVSRRGGRWHPGTARTPSYNQARHEADATGLTVNGPAVKGRLEVVVNPHRWGPADHRAPRRMAYTVDARINDGRIEGTFEGDGDFGAQKGAVSGAVVSATETVALPSDASEKAVPADPAGAATFMAERGTAAYQQGRAAALACFRYPVAFSNALALTRAPALQWGGEGTNTTEANYAGLFDYLFRMRRLLELAIRAEGPGSYVDETVTMDDPFFGPYFADEAMPTNPAGCQELPADAGRDGIQRWQYLGRWRLLAAFPPDVRLDLTTPCLPPLVPASEGAYRAEPALMSKDYEAPKSGLLRWEPAVVPFRFVCPPGQVFDPGGGIKGQTGVHGDRSGRWFAASEIVSPADATIYASAEAQAFGEVWVNDRLVWKREVERPIKFDDVMPLGTNAPPSLFRAPFVKGTNRVLVVCQSGGRYAWFGLTFCTRGAPMAAARREAIREAQAAATANLPPDPRRGRRGDWTGQFPDADPPLGWDVKRGINLMWRTELPDFSAAHPVIAGSRLLVNCEPHTLYCLDKNTGRILWSRESHAFSLLPNEKQAEAMKAWNEYRAAKDSPEKKELMGKLAEVENEKKEKEDAGSLDESARKELNGQIKEIKKSLEFFGAKEGAYWRWCGEAGVADHGWGDNYGWTYPSPVTDGKHVWAKFGTGVAACYDMDGNRKWMVRTGMSGGGQLPSPLLMDGKMILQGQFLRREDAAKISGSCGSPGFFQHVLMALDAQTGETVWQRPMQEMGGYACGAGIVPLRISDGKRVREVVATGSGHLVDPHDGRLLTSCMGVRDTCWHADPFTIGNRVYLCRGETIAAAEVWLEEDGQVGAKVVFRSEKGCGLSGAAYVDGYVFWNVWHTYGKKAIPWIQLHSCDARTGKYIGSLVPALREGGVPYCSPVSAGRYGVISGSGPGVCNWAVDRNSSAKVGFVVPGPRQYLVSEGELHEGMVAAPVFEGNRMYVRTYKSAMCIAVTNEEGRVYALQQKARALLDSIPERPSLRDVTDLPADTNCTPCTDLRVQDFYLQTAPTNWLMAGPFRLAKGEDPLQGLGGAAGARPDLTTVVNYAGTNFAFAPAPDGVVRASGGWHTNYFDVLQFSANCRFDLLAACKNPKDSTVFFYTVVRSPEGRVTVPQFKGGSGATVWVAGKNVAPGQKLRMGKGYYPVMLRVDVGAVPPFGRGVGAEFRFKDVPDPAGELASWTAVVAENRPRLEQLVRELPGSPEARTAKSLLASLEGGVGALH